jgi:hypothetical protein
MLAAAIAAPKISFAIFAMISSSAVTIMLVIQAQKIGLRCRKFHHAFI